MRRAVPALAHWLVAACATARDREWLLADFIEEAEAYAARYGAARARRWAWRQALASAAPLLTHRAAASARTIGGTCMSTWRGLRSDVRLSLRRLAAAP